MDPPANETERRTQLIALLARQRSANKITVERVDSPIPASSNKNIMSEFFYDSSNEIINIVRVGG